MDSNRKQVYLPPIDTNRVIGFSDGIFSFTATLLIVLIAIPNIPANKAPEELPRALLALWPYVTAYILSFLNIALYWKIHYDMYAHITQADNVLIVLNTLFLISVTFLPLPTAIMAQYGDQPVAAAIYGATLAISYLMLYLIGRYANSRKLIRQDIQLPVQRFFRLKLLLPFCLALLGSVLSFVFPRLSNLFYFIIILLNIAPIRWVLRGYELITPWDDEAVRKYLEAQEEQKATT